MTIIVLDESFWGFAQKCNSSNYSNVISSREYSLIDSTFTEMMVQISTMLSIGIAFCKTDILSIFGMTNLLKEKKMFPFFWTIITFVFRVMIKNTISKWLTN